MGRIPKNVVWFFLLATVFLAAAWPQQGSGQGQGQQQPPKPPVQPGQPGQPAPTQPAAPPVNPEEEASYKAFADAGPADVDRRIQLGEEFLKKYPESRYRGAVYLTLLRDYYTKQDVAKMLAAGEKALELNPDNVDVLPWMAMVPPRGLNPDDLDAEQKLQKSENYAKHGIELLTKLTKPANLTEEQFARSKNIALSMCHSGLGVVYFRRGRYPDATTEFEQATQLVPDPDPVDFYLLGMSELQTKRFGDAVTAFEKCSQLPGTLQERCKQSLEQAKKLAAAQPAAPKP